MSLGAVVVWAGLRFSADLNVAVIGVWRSGGGFWKKPLPPVRAFGACVARVARRHDVSTALVYTWRRKLSAALVAAQENHGFVEAVVLEDKSSVPTPGQPAIIVELSHGARVSIYNSASATLAETVVKALAR